MNKIYRFFIALTISAITIAPVASAQAQGYSGLFADDPDKEDVKKQPPAGYTGVIGGSVPATAQPAKPVTKSAVKTPAAAAPLQQTPNPATAVMPITNSGQLEQQAKISAAAKEAQKQMAPVRETWKGLTKQKRVDGLLPAAYTIRSIVDNYMTMVADSKLTPEKRAKNGRLVYNQLVAINEGLQSKKAIPDDVYQDMGLPQNYMLEIKEGNEQALSIVQKALDAVRQYK